MMLKRLVFQRELNPSARFSNTHHNSIELPLSRTQKTTRAEMDAHLYNWLLGPTVLLLRRESSVLSRSRRVL